MDCREFRDNHFAFIDDTLSGIELVGMQRHIVNVKTVPGMMRLSVGRFCSFTTFPGLSLPQDFRSVSMLAFVS